MSSITVEPKKKRGRPATGRDPQIGVRLPAGLLADLDLYCAHAGCSRSDVVREALERWRESYGGIISGIKSAE